MAAVTSAVAAVGGLALSAKSASDQSKAANRSANAQEAASAAQADLIDSQREMAAEQWNVYKNTYLPLETQLAETAKTAGGIASQNVAAQEAAASVAANFQQARQQLSSTPGLDPSSQQYIKEANRLNMQEAATTAATENAARSTVKHQANALLVDAASIGKGLASGATSTNSSAMSAQAGLLSNATSQANTAQSNLNSSMSGLGTALGTASGAIGGLFGNTGTTAATTTTATPSYQLGSYNYGLSGASNYNAGGLGLKY